MSAFEVTSTQDKGYVSNNAATGFKTNQELIKIPQAITVVTRDLIDDIGSTNTSDVLQYAGASNFYRGESLAVRGARINNSYVDEVPDSTPYMDNVFIDSYEVIRGPAAVLYMNASLGGAVLKSTRKPLPTLKGSLNFSLNEYGFYRSELDVTGPLLKTKDGGLNYRLSSSFQDGETYFKNTTNKAFAISPVLSYKYKNTTVNAAFDYQGLDHVPSGMGFLREDGSLNTDFGTKNGGYAPGGNEHFIRQAQRVALFHSFSPDWEMKLRANHYQFGRLGTVLQQTKVNYQTDMLTFASRRNKQNYDNWTLVGDFSGKYEILRFSNQSNFGFSYADEINNSRFWTSTKFGTQNYSFQSVDWNALALQAPETFTPPSNPGSRVQTYRGNIYYQHTLELVKDRLMAVSGWTYSTVTLYNESNIATYPEQVDRISQAEPLHRYGLVFNATKDIALYAMESTTFTPASNKDINQKLLPSQSGKGQEAGVKIALLDGRLSGTFSYFDIKLTNVAVAVGVNSSGASYYEPVGATTQKGWDFDLSMRIIPGWQLVATGYHGKVRDQNGLHVANTYGGLWSLFTRYDFQTDLLRGFAVGGGISRTSDRWVTASGMVFSDGSTRSVIEVAPSAPITLFTSYRYKKYWNFKVSVENVQDKPYVLGLQGPTTVDFTPRTFTFSVAYKF